MPTGPIPWLRILAEGVAIVVSILLAFGIQAWWEERQDRVIEREALVRLEAEFRANRDEVGSGSSAIADSGERLYRMMQAMPSNQGVLMVPDTLLAGFLGVPVFDPTTPVLDGLISSGQMELIRDRRVREAIATWERWLSQLEDFERGRETYAERQLRAGLMSRGNVSPVLFAEGGFDRPPLDSTRVTSLRVDDELKGLVAEKQALARSVAAIRQIVAESADSVVRAIQRAQEES